MTNERTAELEAVVTKQKERVERYRWLLNVSREENSDLRDELRAAKSRIAELEAKAGTVTALERQNGTLIDDLRFCRENISSLERVRAQQYRQIMELDEELRVKFAEVERLRDLLDEVCAQRDEFAERLGLISEELDEESAAD